MDRAMQQSSLQQELNNVINKLHGIFDDIGFEHYDRQSREDNVFNALNAALHEQLKTASKEKNQLLDECRQIISQIKAMEKSLADGRVEEDIQDFDVTAPLLHCLQDLQDRHLEVKRRHTERYEQVKKLVHAVERYAQYMESSLVQITLPPVDNDSVSATNFDLSYAYLERLDNEFNRVYEEYTRRVATVGCIAKDMINLYAELGTQPEQVDRRILEYGNSDPEKLGITKDSIDRLNGQRQRLINEREKRITKVEDLKKQIGELWVKLGAKDSEKKLFLAQHRGCGLKNIRELQIELDRLLELKRANLGVFVEDCRNKLRQLWDLLYFGDFEKEEFAAAYTDVYTDSLLQAHEMEINRLQELLAERQPIISLINKHRDLMNDKEQLAISANDSSRLLGRGGPGGRDPTRLLREEKMRKRIAKELPRVEAELKKALEKWDEDSGAPMLVHGQDYLANLIRSSPVAQSRAAGTKTPASKPPVSASNSTVRGRASTMVAPSRQRSKSRPNNSEKPRSKTPTARPKTPNNGQLSNYQSGTIGRSGGRGLASAQSISSTSSFMTTSTSSSGTSSSYAASIDRSAMKTPGPAGRSIPQTIGTIGSKTPTRIARPPLSVYPGGMNSPQRQEPPPTMGTLGRNASIKRKVGPTAVGTLVTAPKMQQLFSAPENKVTDLSQYSRPSELYDDELRESSASIHRIRSVSPTENVTYERRTEEEDLSATPKANPQNRNPSYADYESSAARFQRIREEPPVETRNFSSSSTFSTISGTSSNGNWETYGEETDSEMDPRESYYRQKADAGYTGYGNAKGTSMVHDTELHERMSEVGF